MVAEEVETMIDRGVGLGIIHRKSERMAVENREALEQIAELIVKIREPPRGYISKKTIGGKGYYDHTW